MYGDRIDQPVNTSCTVKLVYSWVLMSNYSEVSESTITEDESRMPRSTTSTHPCKELHADLSYYSTPESPGGDMAQSLSRSILRFFMHQANIESVQAQAVCASKPASIYILSHHTCCRLTMFAWYLGDGNGQSVKSEVFAFLMAFHQSADSFAFCQPANDIQLITISRL